jgi:hypothetical protein
MTNSNKIKAEIAIVQIGYIEIEGLYAEKIDQFGVGIVQVCNLFSEPRKRSLKQLEALWGITFQNHQKWVTSLNPKAINVISLIDFEKVLRALDRKGNQKAQHISDELIGLSLHQLFSDAFNIYFDEEDRQQWLKARQEGKKVRRTLTDAIKDWLLGHPETSINEAKFMYATVTDTFNYGVFNRGAKQLKIDWSCFNPRDEMTDQELQYIASLESLTMRLIDNDKLHPLTAAKEAVNRLIIPVITR